MRKIKKVEWSEAPKRMARIKAFGKALGLDETHFENAKVYEHVIPMWSHDPDGWIGKVESRIEVGKVVEVTVTLRRGYRPCESCSLVCDECGQHHLHIERLT